MKTAWPTAQLGEVVDFLDHKRRPITASARLPGPYPYYGANGQQDSVAGYIFDEPLVLLAEDGGHFDEPKRGIAYRVGGKCWVNNHAHVLRPKAVVDLVYLTRVLENADVQRVITGTTRAKLTKAGASAIEIPLPPIEEQRRIAAVLDAADAVRANRRQALAKLDTLTQAIFIDMFGDPRTNPRGLRLERLGDLCLTKGEYGAGVSSEPWTPSKPRYLRITDIQADGRLTADRVGPAGEATSWASKLLRPGDVVFARSGATVGKTYLARPRDEPMVFAGYLIRFTPDPSRLAPEYLLQYTRTSLYRSWVANTAEVVAQPNLNAQKYSEMRIPLPTLPEQERFAELAGRIESQAQVWGRAAASLDALFASLQQRAFRGEL